MRREKRDTEKQIAELKIQIDRMSEAITMQARGRAIGPTAMSCSP